MKTGARTKSIRQILGLIVLALVMAACGQAEAPGDGDDGVTVTIDQGSSAELVIGDPLDLSATVDGAADGVDWSSSDPAIATVTDAGVVTATDTAVEGDEVDITATSEADASASDTIELTVVTEPTNGGADEPGIDPSGVFVDDDAAGGGDGSEGSPFQTIEAGIDAAEDGQTVNVLAGTYTETIVIDKPLALNGEGEVIIDADGTTAEGGAFGAIDINGITGVTLSGFTLQVEEPGSLVAAVAMYAAASEVEIIGVDIEHSSELHGINIVGSTSVSVDGVTVTGDNEGSGAGVRITDASSDVDLTAVTTDGHENFAGVVLIPGAATMSNISIAGTFDEINKMTAILTGAGELTGLTAPQFTHVVRNLHPEGGGGGIYGSGDWWFYKDDVDVALRDALFNFAADEYFIGEAANLGIEEGDVAPEEGAASIVHTLDPDDKSELGNVIIVGEVTDDFFGYGITRSSNIQVALDQASALDGVDTVTAQVGTYRGHEGAVTVPGDVTLQGEGVDQSVVIADVADPEDVLIGPGEPGNVTGVGEELPGI